MRLASVKRGDRILAEVRGHRFIARVRNPQCGEVPRKPVLVDPEHPNISFRHLMAHQVKEIIGEETLL